MPADVLPSRVYLQQAGYEEALVNQMLEPQETSVQVAQRERQRREMEPGIARRHGATSVSGLFLLESPPGCIELANASVQRR